MNILCLADLHLGRSPSRLHPDLTRDVGQLGPAEAWRRSVDHAIRARVDAVLLAGDVIDSDSDYFEAFGDLRDGAQRLAAAGVSVVAVAGNHDADALTRLARAVQGVVLLGAGGSWEHVDLVGQAGRVRVVGWSFPARWVEASPLSSAGLAEALTAPAPDTGGARPAPLLATVGLLHADLDQATSRYAPVSTSALAAVAGVDAWLLGHVHRPDLSAGLTAGDPARFGRAGRAIGYVGSVTALHPGDVGARGCWLLEVVPAAGQARFAHVPLAPLRWEELELDVGALAEPAGLRDAVIATIVRLDARTRERHDGVGHPGPAAVGCRVRLTGRSAFRRELAERLRQEPLEGELLRLGGVTYFVDEVTMDVRQSVDVADLAGRQDPVGLLARRLLALREPGSDLRRRLVAELGLRLTVERHRAHFARLGQPEPDEVTVVRLLEAAASRLLDELLAQDAYGHGGGQAGGSAEGSGERSPRAVAPEAEP